MIGKEGKAREGNMMKGEEEARWNETRGQMEGEKEYMKKRDGSVKEKLGEGGK